MQQRKLYGLKPDKVFEYFEKLCRIPHGSGNTKQISDYLVAYANEQGLRYIQDPMNNVIIFADATPGYEERDPVIIQGHMDMVCEKDADCPIDMEKEGLDIAHDGKYIFANGTTLGGDDGIAIAFALALMADKSIPHPALEVIITVDEETGMYGAAGLDASSIKGKTLINIDSEEEGVFTVSCAGGMRVLIELPITRRAVYGPCVSLKVEGLQGGHSGVDIDKKRANANKVMGMFLDRVQKLMPVCITKLQGGAKDNAIAYSAQATVVALGMYIERINDVASQLQQEIREQFDEPNALIFADDVDALGANALTTQCSAQVIALLNAAPDGIQSWSKDIEGLVQTSLNLGVVTLDDSLKMSFALRSSVNKEKEELRDRLGELAAFYDATCECSGDYPAWEYKADSRLRDTMAQVYEKMFQVSPKIVAIHAGLECGLLSQKIPGLDCISIGPNMHDIHTSRERLEIESVQRIWAFLQEVLKQL